MHFEIRQQNTNLAIKLVCKCTKMIFFKKMYSDLIIICYYYHFLEIMMMTVERVRACMCTQLDKTLVVLINK